jgi:ribA/ribD-fused uncharacterized protein
MAKVKEKNGETRTNRYSVAPFIKEFYNEYYSIEQYPEEKCAAFNTTAGKWGIFGNFANTPLVIDGVPFKSSEHLFQTMKFKDADIVKKVYIGTTFKGCERKGPKYAAKSYETQGFRREDWGAMIVDALKFCLQSKYEQSKEFRDELERAKGYFIVEDQSTRKRGKNATADTWGALLRNVSYVGPNLLGRLLMELRDNGKLEYNLPDDALDFIEILKK